MDLCKRLLFVKGYGLGLRLKVKVQKVTSKNFVKVASDS